MARRGMAWMISSSPSPVISTMTSRVHRTVGTDDQPAVGILAQIVDEHRVFDGVEDVVVRDAVAARGRVDLHTAILYYESGGRRRGRDRVSLPNRPPRSRFDLDAGTPGRIDSLDTTRPRNQPLDTTTLAEAVPTFNYPYIRDILTIDGTAIRS